LEHRDLAAAAQEGHQTYVQAQSTYATTTSATAPEDLEKAKGDAAAAHSALEAARRVFDNRASLFQQGAIPKKSLDDAQVALVQAQAQADLARQHLMLLEKVGQSEQLKSARAQLEAAKAHYDSAAAQEQYAEIRAPIAGVMADRAANVGGMAASGSPLMTIVDLSEVTARANLAVADAINIRSGQNATLSVAGISVQGVVKVVSPVVDPNTTTLQIWVQAKNPGERLKPGLTATVVIQAGEIPNATVVPVAALLSSDEGGDKVMVAGSDHAAHETPVKTGARDGDDVQILEGVKPGEQVIVSGALGLDDKAKISIGKGEAE
jgi:multidrug efflux pump subunit AcrA (membrane-fusion protein)